MLLKLTCKDKPQPFFTFEKKLGRVPLGGATYYILRLYALWFQTRRFFPVSLYKSMQNM